MSKRFFGRDLVTVDSLTKEDLRAILARADRMKKLVEKKGGDKRLAGKILACIFYEPSTRTSSSFIAAIQRLGGGIIPITQGVQFSSVAKGENLEDTVRTLERYADVIVIRHPEVGASALAAKVAQKPVISGGDGVGEHPTQALLDLLTIRNELGKIDGLHIAMVGDLKYGRTVHSLTKLLCRMYNVRLSFVSPNILRLPSELREEVEKRRRTLRETSKVEDVIGAVDVLYVTRVQKERFKSLKEYEKVKDFYVITPQVLKKAKKKMIVMHPLPRVGEIRPEVDEDPRAAYFRQVENGLYIRMALFDLILRKDG